MTTVMSAAPPCVSQDSTAVLNDAFQAVEDVHPRFQRLAFWIWQGCCCTTSSAVPLAGLDDDRLDLLQMCMNAKPQVLLTGPAGVGKTTAIRSIAKSLDISTEWFEPQDTEEESVVDGLQRVYRSARKKQPCVVVIDSAEIYFTRVDVDNEQSNAHAAALVRHMTAVLPTEQIVSVIVATDARAIHPRIVSVTLDHVDVDLPNFTERLHLLQKEIGNRLSPDDGYQLLNEVAEQCNGFSVADLCSLASIAIRFEIKENTHDTPFVNRKNFDKALSYFGLKVLPRSDVSEWYGLCGFAKVKQTLEEDFIRLFSQYESLKMMPGAVPKGLLLYGSSGLGKSLLAKSVADACQASVFSLTVADLAQPEIGESERILSKTFFSAAQAVPSIIMLDDIHVLFGPREEIEGGVGKLIVTQLILEIDRSPAGVAVIATAPTKKHVDRALLRPGRIDQFVLLEYPDEIARLEILRQHCCKLDMAHDVSLEAVASITIDYTCADLTTLVRNAVLHSLRRNEPGKCEVKQQDFMGALMK